MPTRPLRLCRKPGCSNLVERGYCEQHRKDNRQEIDKRRLSAAKRGYDYKWQEYRKRFLAKNPICIECEKDGKIELATVVDHIIPHRGDKALFWDSSNHQPLCKRHHDMKTLKETMRRKG